MTHKVIRNHAQSGSGHSLCLGRRRTRARGVWTSLLIHWVWWLRNKEENLPPRKSKNAKIHYFPLNSSLLLLSLSLSVARARSLISQKERRGRERWLRFSILSQITFFKSRLDHNQQHQKVRVVRAPVSKSSLKRQVKSS